MVVAYLVHFSGGNSAALFEKVRPRTHNSAVNRISVIATYDNKIGVLVVLYQAHNAVVECRIRACQLKVPDVPRDTVWEDMFRFALVLRRRHTAMGRNAL